MNFPKEENPSSWVMRIAMDRKEILRDQASRILHVRFR
jgi:hypothetical protein